MTRLGLLSDTHGYLDEKLLSYLAECDEIWHAGDIGSWAVAEKLAALRPLRAVFGNCDGGDVRLAYPKKLCRRCEEADILMTHIGGRPGHYDASVREQLVKRTPNLFICGHSHILRVEYDKDLNMLFINPGAAGLSGWQQVRTIVRLTVDGNTFKDLEVVEMER